MLRRILPAALLAALVAPASAEIFYFTNQDVFQQFNLLDGKHLKFTEDFEEGVVPPGGKQPLPDPLEPGTPNTVGPNGFPNGLAAPNLRIQANTDPQPSPPNLNPSGSPLALFLAGPGAFSNSNKVGEDLGILSGQIASLDLIFLDDDKTGIGLDLMRFMNINDQVGFNVTIYNTNNVIIGNILLPPPPQPGPAKMFFGVWSDDPIGRINIFDDDVTIPGQPIISPSAVDNIEMWVPEPSGLLLLVAAAPLLRRRR